MHERLQSFFEYLSAIDRFFWTYIGFVILFSSGIYLTIKTRGFQFKVLLNFRACITDLLKGPSKCSSRGIHPIRLYFASVSGMVGLGNVVGIITAVMIGGPGALLWLWIGNFPSMLVKYAEIYLGIRYRIPNDQGGYDGGPMFYLRKAFKNKTIPFIASLLLCIYGVEVFQFDVVADTISETFHINQYLVIALLLGGVLFTVIGGIRRLSQVCTFLMPIFIILYVGMCVYVIVRCSAKLPETLSTIVSSAFSGHAAIGGFAGSSAMLAAQQGISRSVYSGDIGIGYDSIIQAETRAILPQQQARLGVFSLLTDAIICTLSICVVLVTDVWTLPLHPDQFVGHALATHFKHADLFMAIFIFLAGYTTIVAYLSVGLKSAFFLGGVRGKVAYLTYAVVAFVFFSFCDQEKALLVMSLAAGMLIVFNITGILRLLKFIKFQ
ncbi:MAG: amino acid carrier protein [Holosporales bacterium]|jgi:AGCS family alanine or glycine:cation symporter|nr:amino acid carrier protein [Holosporales bacterium]